MLRSRGSRSRTRRSHATPNRRQNSSKMSRHVLDAVAPLRAALHEEIPVEPELARSGRAAGRRAGTGRGARRTPTSRDGASRARESRAAGGVPDGTRAGTPAARRVDRRGRDTASAATYQETMPSLPNDSWRTSRPSAPSRLAVYLVPLRPLPVTRNVRCDSTERRRARAGRSAWGPRRAGRPRAAAPLNARRCHPMLLPWLPPRVARPRARRRRLMVHPGAPSR